MACAERTPTLTDEPAPTRVFAHARCRRSDVDVVCDDAARYAYQHARVPYTSAASYY